MSIALRLVLHLPRDAATVPLVRRLLDQALRTLGVVDGCRDDIGLILTEACANVIEHALQIDDYEITIDVTGVRCVIHVVNAGAVVDPARLAPAAAAVVAADPVPAASAAAPVAAAAVAAEAEPVVPAARAPQGAAVDEPVLDAILDEHGRGLHIIRSLADEVYVTPALSGGLVLQAVVTLRWTADAEVWQRR